MKFENDMFRKHAGSQYTVMISKPPRPPSWRDFIPDEPPKADAYHSKQSSSSKPSKTLAASSSASKRNKDVEFSNLSRIQHKSYSEGSDLSRLGIGGQPHYHGSHSNLRHVGSQGIGHSQTLPNPNTSSKGKRHHHRSHGRLHRTTSQYNIEQSDLPKIEHVTLSLANTKLQKKDSYGFDPLLYLDENAKRCERWLQQVHASQPLEDVNSSKLSSPAFHIPEVGLNEHELSVKTPVELCSGSGSEVDSVSVCAVHRTDLSDREREAHVRLPGGRSCKSENLTNHHLMISTRQKPELKDVIEESSSTHSTTVPNNRLRVSKENRDPSSMSSSSEEIIQQRNNRKNLSDPSSGSFKEMGCINLEEGNANIKLDFNR